jgi:hypothetical protein
MRAALAAVALFSAVAIAQDSARPRPVGTALLDALPPQTDLVVATPDLPALLTAAEKAGLGAAAAWREAFDAQLAAWGAPTGRPERLVAGAHAFLGAAEGEALVAAVSLRPRGSDPIRATLLAFRTTRDEKALRAAFKDVTDGGLWLRWDGDPRDEEIAGRAVVTLPSGHGSLHAVLGDGLVAVCDHPLALGLFLRGLADAKAAPAVESELRLTVRHGRGDRGWEGFVWGERETAQWKDAAPRAARIPATPSTTRVFAVAGTSPELPLFPIALESLQPTSGRTGGGAPSYLALDGSSLVGGFDDAAHPVCAGAAWRLGWLRALAAGKLAFPVPDVDVRLLRAPLDGAVKTAGKADGEFVSWTSSGPGRLAGPFGHGPATFLALRTLHDIAHGAAPESAPDEGPRAPVGEPRGGAPLPPPKEPGDK